MRNALELSANRIRLALMASAKARYVDRIFALRDHIAKTGFVLHLMTFVARKSFGKRNFVIKIGLFTKIVQVPHKDQGILKINLIVDLQKMGKNHLFLQINAPCAKIMR